MDYRDAVQSQSLLGARTDWVLMLFLVVLRVTELGDNLPGMAAGVVVVGVATCLLLGALLAAVAREDVLVVIKVVVVVVVQVRL